MTFTAEEHERVLKAVGLAPITEVEMDLKQTAGMTQREKAAYVSRPRSFQQTDGKFYPQSNGRYGWEAPDLTQDDLAAKYLLPVATPHIDPMWPQDNGWGIMYSGNDVIFSDDENIVCGATFGEALFNFVLALLDADVIPEVPE